MHAGGLFVTGLFVTAGDPRDGRRTTVRIDPAMRSGLLQVRGARLKATTA